MWREGDIRRWAAATLLLAALGLPPGQRAAAAGPDAGIDAALPDPAAVVEAYLTARRWIDSLQPPSMSEPEARLKIEGASGVCIVLRRTGRIVGTATAATGEADLLLRRAVGRALAKVLGDPAVAGLPEEIQAEIGRSLTLEMEVAGRPEPLLGRTAERIARELEPGMDGIALRRGASWAMLFPAQLRATNTAGAAAGRIGGLAGEIGLPATDPGTLIERHRVSIYRFRTTHLVQSEPDRLPFETFRGDTVVAQSQVSEQTIAALGDGIAAHLLRSQWPVDAEREASNTDEAGAGTWSPRSRVRWPGLRGDYRPVSDTHRPLIAPPLEQALAAFALGRYADAPGVDPDTAAEARTASARIIEALAKDKAGALADLRACAALIYAVAGQPAKMRSSAAERLQAEAARMVAASYADGEFRLTGSEVGDQPVPPHVQALLAGAMARESAAGGAGPDATGRVDGEHLREVIDAVWAGTPEPEYVNLLPWIAWAELDYARAVERDEESMARLGRLAEALSRARVREGPLDAHGGFALASPDGTRRPTSQSTRPGAFFASILGDEHLTSAHRLDSAVAEHFLTMRYLMQLSVRPTLTWSMRSPDRAMGGLRNSTWESNLPVAAQAMGLLATAETLRSIERVGQR